MNKMGLSGHTLKKPTEGIVYTGLILEKPVVYRDENWRQREIKRTQNPYSTLTWTIGFGGD
jgi:hypothetical protein